MNTLIKEFPFWTKFNNYKAQINFEKKVAMKFNSEKEIEEILHVVKEKFFKSWKEDGSIIHFQQLFKYKNFKINIDFFILTIQFKHIIINFTYCFNI